MLRLLALGGTIVAAALLWMLGQPVEAEDRQPLIRLAALVLLLIGLILAVGAYFSHGAGSGRQETEDEFVPLADGPLYLLAWGLATLGLLGMALAGFRFLRAMVMSLYMRWLDWRVERSDPTRGIVAPETVDIGWIRGIFRTARQMLTYVLIDFGLSAVLFIYLFVLGIGFWIANWALVLVIPFMVQAVVRRNMAGVICVFGLLLYFGGLLATHGLSREDISYGGGITASFLSEVGQDEVVMIYRLGLFTLILAAAMSRVAAIWVPVGGLAFGALLYLLFDDWPCVPMLDACMPDPASSWGYMALGLLLFAGMHALRMLTGMQRAR